MKRMTAVVTGASGYLGAHVTRALLAAGHAVHATVRDAQDERKTAHLRALPGSERLTLFSADLLAERSFDEAFAGCDWACHVASPVSFKPRDPQADVIDPAVNGTLGVLGAAARAGSVSRVVVTSSMAAVAGFEARADTRYTDQHWNDTSTARRSAYPLSKVLAERAAWRFAAERELDLVTILPGYVFGPILCRSHIRTSVSFVYRMMRGKAPMYPHLNLPLADVEDVALAHLRALERPAAHGRYLVVSGSHWLAEIAAVIRERFPELPVPRRRAPNLLVYLAALFDRDATPYYFWHSLGKTLQFDGARTQRELGLELKPFAQSIVETAESIQALAPAVSRRAPAAPGSR